MKKQVDTRTNAENRIRKAKSRNKMREWLKEKQTPCLFCGAEEDIIWHHINPNEKKGRVSDLVSWNYIKEESEKCWNLCESCHTKLHQRLVDPLPECY